MNYREMLLATSEDEFRRSFYGDWYNYEEEKPLSGWIHYPIASIFQNPIEVFWSEHYMSPYNRNYALCGKKLGVALTQPYDKYRIVIGYACRACERFSGTISPTNATRMRQI